MVVDTVSYCGGSNEAGGDEQVCNALRIDACEMQPSKGMTIIRVRWDSRGWTKQLE